MMKNKKNMIFVLLICVVIIASMIMLTKKTDGDFLQEYDYGNNIIKDVSADNGLKLTNGKIEKNNGLFYVYMVATNNTKNDIDMSDYRISFISSSGEEIEYFSGEIIGIVKAGESFDFVVESYQDLTKTKNIFYEYVKEYK